MHSCRKAKESLFSSGGPDEYPVTVLGRGSGLIAGTIKVSLKLEDIQQVVLDGFFPKCSLDDKPAKSSAAGMKEFGLLYEPIRALPGIWPNSYLPIPMTREIRDCPLPSYLTAVS